MSASFSFLQSDHKHGMMKRIGACNDKKIEMTQSESIESTATLKVKARIAYRTVASMYVVLLLLRKIRIRKLEQQ